jgi:hypothetical protein
MATSKLLIYNGALMLCEARSIASLTVNEEARRLLDNVYDDGGIQYCLEQGQWRFAMRTSKMSYDTGITPSFGYRRAFAKPADWVNTSAVCSDEYFNVPLLQYTDEAGFWYSDLDEIYVKYVSNDANYGMNLSLWPYSFTEYVKAYFASRICGKIAASRELSDSIKKRGGVLEMAHLSALSRDAMAEPTKLLPPGSWVKARTGNSGDWRDGGNRNSLIG